MEFEIIRVEHKDIKKYICDFALDKNIFSELGYPIFSDNNHTWYIAINQIGVIGFCSAVKKINHISFNHDYVIPKYRLLFDVYKKLFDHRLNDYKNNYIKSVCTRKSLKTFLKNNFTIIKKTKNYTFVEYGKQNKSN